MLLVRTYLAQSSIEGLGVFAGEFIRAGTQLWALNPKFDVFVEQREFEALPSNMRDYVRRYAYPHLEMPGILVLDADDGKFMNHSDTPNTNFTIFDRAFATRDIAPGEEITCNYREFDPTFTGFFGDVAKGVPHGRNGSGNSTREPELRTQT